MSNNNNQRTPSYHFTLFDGYIVGLHAKHPSTFVVYATDHERYWASSFRHKHLLQDHRNTSILPALFEAFAASFDEGTNLNGITQGDDGDSLLLDIEFSHHGIDHRITLTLSECVSDDRLKLVATLVTDLYTALAKWRSSSKAATKLANACMATKGSNSKQNNATSPTRAAAKKEEEEAVQVGIGKMGTNKDEEKINKELSSLTTPLRQRGWKPTNNHSKGYFSRPEFLSSQTPYANPKPSNPFHGTVFVAPPGQAGKLGNQIPSGSGGVGCIRTSNGFIPPKRYGSTKEELRLQILAQQQQLMAIQKENMTLLNLQHQQIEQRRWDVQQDSSGEDAKAQDEEEEMKKGQEKAQEPRIHIHTHNNNNNNNLNNSINVPSSNSNRPSSGTLPELNSSNSRNVVTT